MSADAWTWWCAQVEEALDRHRKYPELRHRLDAMQADLKLRAALADALADDKKVEEMLRGLTACLDALQDAIGDSPERPEGTS